MTLGRKETVNKPKTKKTAKRASGSLERRGYAPPRYYWKQCYEMGDRVHWALCDTQTDADAPPWRVSCLEMILWDHHSQDLPNQLMPKLIVELLNAHYAKAHNADISDGGGQ